MLRPAGSPSPAIGEPAVTARRGHHKTEAVLWSLPAHADVWKIGPDSLRGDSLQGGEGFLWNFDR